MGLSESSQYPQAQRRVVPPAFFEAAGAFYKLACFSTFLNIKKRLQKCRRFSVWTKMLGLGVCGSWALFWFFTQSHASFPLFSLLSLVGLWHLHIFEGPALFLKKEGGFTFRFFIYFEGVILIYHRLSLLLSHKVPWPAWVSPPFCLLFLCVPS